MEEMEKKIRRWERGDRVAGSNKGVVRWRRGLGIWKGRRKGKKEREKK